MTSSAAVNMVSSLESLNGRVLLKGMIDAQLGQRAEHPDYEPDLNLKRAKGESDAQQQSLI